MKFLNKKWKIFLAVIAISLISFTAAAQIYVGDSDAMFYRGKREPKESGSFSVLNITTTRVDSNAVRFDILFNHAIDPNSASGASFYINGAKANAKGKIEFSKDGKKIRVVLGTSDSSFNFEVKGIKSYNDKLVNRITVKLKDNGEVRVSSE